MTAGTIYIENFRTSTRSKQIQVVTGTRDEHEEFQSRYFYHNRGRYNPGSHTYRGDTWTHPADFEEVIDNGD